MEEGKFVGHDGSNLYRRSWPVASPKGHVLLIHGYGEHCGRYDHVAAHLNGLGLSVWSYDQRYHGQSPGPRGTVLSFDALVRDCHAFIEHMIQMLGDAPRIVMGHSMGGLVLAHVLVENRYDFRGAVFSSAFLDIKEVSPILLALAGVLSKVCPRLPVEDLPADAVSRIPEVVAAYENDPLNNHKKINARTGEQMTNAVQGIRPCLRELTLPLYIFHGDADALVPCSASTFLHEQCSSEDKTLTIYPGGYHELMNDLEQEAVLASLGNWIVEHLE